MKKNILRIAAVALITAMLAILSSCSRGDYDFSLAEAPLDGDSLPLMHLIDPDSEVRGVWIASVYNIDFPSRSDLTPYELKCELDNIISSCTECGINTIYFQVRPSCDALYASDIFPVSEWLTHGGYLSFDPLEYILDAAHHNNIFVHAWVNPLRVSVNSTDISSLPGKSPAKAHPDWVVEYNGQLYFDAGIPEVRSLVSDGVREIVEKYDVDGVVFDDYFYPYPTYDEAWHAIPFDDAETFAEYGSDSTNIEDWRRGNINSMIRACFEAVHSADSECVFGVSPFGVWQNNDGKNGGSDTTNLQAYSELYCDALAWAKGGYVDFLSPQLYWDFKTESSPFDVVMRWWNAALDGTGVKLIPSHALHNYNGVWANPAGEISEQIAYARAEKTYFGSVCYGYSVIRDNICGAADELAHTYSDEIVYTNILSNGLGVTVSSPENGSVTYESRTYLIGSCDPFYPLTVNGSPVSLTKSGYFSLFVTLEEGENVLVFEQNGKKYEYKITYKTSYDVGETKKSGISADEIKFLEVYPSLPVATSDGTTWVHCVAPANSRVTASVGGIVTELKPLTSPVGDEKGYACITYGAEAALPAAPDGEISDCGNVKFSLSHRDGDASADGADVRVLGKDAMLCVEALGDYTELKITENSSYYNDYTVQSAGMTDYADSLGDGFYHLRMGGFVHESYVREITDPLPSDKCRISAVSVTDDGKNTSIVFSAADRMPYNGCIDGGTFVVTFYNADSESAAEPEIADNPFFSSCDVIRLNGKVRYSFPLADLDNFYGFDLEYGDGGITVTLRDPILTDPASAEPLGGLTIVLDAGHGGDESGAAGAKTGASPLDEEDLNLAIVRVTADKLRALGADVLLTREDDVTCTLYDRMDFLEAVEPDLCISVHQNSMGFTSDITRIRGTLGLWTMDGGAMLAECVGQNVALSLGRRWIGSQYQALAMCRNPKFPAALVEVGFMTSVEEYEAITSARGIEKAASGIVDGILEYFARQAEYLEK